MCIRDRSSLGFGGTVKSKAEVEEQGIYRQVEPHDLVKYGLIPELVGRIPVIASLDALDEEALVQMCIRDRDMVEEFGYRLQTQGMNMDMYMKYTGTTPEALTAQFMPQAEAQVRTTLLLEKIAEVENIERCV